MERSLGEMQEPDQREPNYSAKMLRHKLQTGSPGGGNPGRDLNIKSCQKSRDMFFCFSMQMCHYFPKNPIFPCLKSHSRGSTVVEIEVAKTSKLVRNPWKYKSLN